MASKYHQKFPIPEGFPEILDAFAMEILRDQPLDIIAYSAEYFKHQDLVHSILYINMLTQQLYLCIGRTLRLSAQRCKYSSPKG